MISVPFFISVCIGKIGICNAHLIFKGRRSTFSRKLHENRTKFLFLRNKTKINNCKILNVLMMNDLIILSKVTRTSHYRHCLSHPAQVRQVSCRATYDTLKAIYEEGHLAQYIRQGSYTSSVIIGEKLYKLLPHVINSMQSLILISTI